MAVPGVALNGTALTRRAIKSAAATSFERGQAFANVDRGSDLPVEAVDPRVDPPDLRGQFVLDRIDLLIEGVDLGREAGVDPVDLGTEPRVDPVDLLIEQPEIAANRVKLGRDEVLKGSLDLVVQAHAAHRIVPREQASMSPSRYTRTLPPSG